MLKTMIFIIMSVFGAASMAVAGTQLNTMPVGRNFRPVGGPATHGKLPDLIPVVKNPFNGVITVKNIGGATAAASNVVISCKKQGYAGSGDGCVDSPPTLKQYDTPGGMAFPVHALDPGQSQQVNILKLANIPDLHSLPWQSGTYHFTVMADGGRVVAESNEDNNKVVTSMIAFRSVRMHKIGPVPDLVIAAATIRPARVCRSGAPALYVTARVRNIGQGPSAARPSVGMVQARETGGVNWGNGHGLPVLAPGATASVTFPIYYLQSDPAHMRGIHTFRLTVNAGKWIRESNFTNNGFKPVKVTLPSGFCGTVRRADITSRKGIKIGNRFSRWGGQINLGGKGATLRASNGKCAFDVYYDMTNAGSAATNPAFVNRLREGAAVVSQQTALHLNAGQTKTIHTQAYLSPGEHIVSLSLDDGRAVAESNEGNNRFRVRVNVKNSCGNIGYIRPAAPPRMPPPSQVMPPSPRLRLNRGGAAAPTIHQVSPSSRERLNRGGAAGRNNRIPGLLAPSTIHLKKKLAPAHPKIKLSPPTMRLMQLPAR